MPPYKNLYRRLACYNTNTYLMATSSVIIRATRPSARRKGESPHTASSTDHIIQQLIASKVIRLAAAPDGMTSVATLNASAIISGTLGLWHSTKFPWSSSKNRLSCSIIFTVANLANLTITIFTPDTQKAMMLAVYWHYGAKTSRTTLT